MSVEFEILKAFKFASVAYANKFYLNLTSNCNVAVTQTLEILINRHLKIGWSRREN